MAKLSQRVMINNLLVLKHPNGLTTLEICDRFPQIRVEVVRRNLQELLAMNQVTKRGTGEFSMDNYGREHEVMRWFAVNG